MATQIDDLDQQVENGGLMLAHLKQARSSLLCSLSVLEARRDELEAEHPEQFEFDLEPLVYPLEETVAIDPDPEEWGQLPDRACSEGEVCESCQ